MKAAGLVVENLSLRLGGFRLRELDLALDKGEILVILGPNGAGKSVTLETIAGFHRPETGRICIRGRDVTAQPPERRNVGLLFQNYGLFPHLTVAENIAFGLYARRRRTDARAAQIEPLIAQFGIAHLRERHPPELSPGEKQRVALARAFATHPDVCLFDEPFAALDTRMREELRGELLAFLRRMEIPAIIVTHDYTDAMTLADKIAVIRLGAIVQSGSVSDIFRKPRNGFVAGFIGMENLLDARIEGEAGNLVAVAIGGSVLSAAANGVEARAGEKVRIAIRAEDVAVFPAASRPSAPKRDVNRLDARIVAIAGSRPLCAIELDCGFPLKAYALRRQIEEMTLVAGGPVSLEIAAEAVHLMPASE